MTQTNKPERNGLPPFAQRLDEGFLPELPSVAMLDPQRRQDLDRKLNIWLDMIPPLQADEDNDSWLARAGAQFRNPAPSIADLAEFRRARPPRRQGLFKPHIQMAARSADDAVNLPGLIELRDANLELRFRAEAGEIVIEITALRRRLGPEPGWYAAQTDLALVFGDPQDAERSWVGTLAFTGLSADRRRADAILRLTDLPQHRRLLSAVQLVQLITDPD